MFYVYSLFLFLFLKEKNVDKLVNITNWNISEGRFSAEENMPVKGCDAGD